MQKFKLLYWEGSNMQSMEAVSLTHLQQLYTQHFKNPSPGIQFAEAVQLCKSGETVHIEL